MKKDLVVSKRLYNVVFKNIFLAKKYPEWISIMFRTLMGTKKYSGNIKTRNMK